jgi:hypothetical protein
MGPSKDELNSFVHLTRISELHPHFVIVHGFICFSFNPLKHNIIVLLDLSSQLSIINKSQVFHASSNNLLILSKATR